MSAVRERYANVRAWVHEDLREVAAPAGFAAPQVSFRRDAPLASLASATLASRFHGWRGQSGRRYVCSVFGQIEAASGFCDAVILAVRAGTDGARAIVAVLDAGPVWDNGGHAGFLARSARLGAVEWHVHLLACEAAQRRKMLEDLGF